MGIDLATHIADYISTIAWIWDKRKTKAITEAWSIQDFLIAEVAFPRDIFEDMLTFSEYPVHVAAWARHVKSLTQLVAWFDLNLLLHDYPHLADQVAVNIPNLGGAKGYKLPTKRRQGIPRHARRRHMRRVCCRGTSDEIPWSRQRGERYRPHQDLRHGYTSTRSTWTNAREYRWTFKRWNLSPTVCKKNERMPRNVETNSRKAQSRRTTRTKH